MRHPRQLNAAALADTRAAGREKLGRPSHPHDSTQLSLWSIPWQASYPWAGLFRCLVESYRRDLPHLRELVLDQIDHEARL